jgi:hypothetical protein
MFESAGEISPPVVAQFDFLPCDPLGFPESERWPEVPEAKKRPAVVIVKAVHGHSDRDEGTEENGVRQAKNMHRNPGHSLGGNHRWSFWHPHELCRANRREIPNDIFAAAVAF